jgi:hypothetical protein
MKSRLVSTVPTLIPTSTDTAFSLVSFKVERNRIKYWKISTAEKFKKVVLSIIVNGFSNATEFVKEDKVRSPVFSESEIMIHKIIRRNANRLELQKLMKNVYDRFFPRL